MKMSDLAQTLQQQDPNRFGASLIAPPDARARLWTLYALNHELARAPLQTNEPLLAQMRLQWWADQLQAGSNAAPHELLSLLTEAWGTRLPQLAALTTPRFRDSERLPFAGADDAEAYIRDTAIPLMRLAISALDAESLKDEAAEIVDAQALGTGILSWLTALPQLKSYNLGLAHDAPAAIRELARRGRVALERARSGRRLIPRRYGAALFRGENPDASLARIERDGEILPVLPSEFRRRFALGRLALTGRWWG